MRKRLFIIAILFNAVALSLPLQAELPTTNCRLVLTFPKGHGDEIYEVDIGHAHWQQVTHHVMTDVSFGRLIHEGSIDKPLQTRLEERFHQVCWTTNHPAWVEFADTPAGCLFADENGWLATDLTRVCKDPELRRLALDTLGLLRKRQLLALLARLQRSGAGYQCLVPLLETLARAKKDLGPDPGRTEMF